MHSIERNMSNLWRHNASNLLSQKELVEINGDVMGLLMKALQEPELGNTESLEKRLHSALEVLLQVTKIKEVNVSDESVMAGRS